MYKPSMKITPEHYEMLSTAIEPLDTPSMRERFWATAPLDRIRDVNAAYRWGLLHVALPAHKVCDALYPYMNDTHIDTALKAIVPALERQDD